MIKVKVLKENEEIKHILISGHSGYSDAGSDIVCAAVSSVVTTSVNAVLTFKETIEVKDDGDTLEIHVQEHDTITNTLLENMLNLLKEIERQYKENIRMEEENEC